MILPALLAVTGAALVLGGPEHAHRCPCCGTRWSHRGVFVGNEPRERAHRCPRCARLEYLQERPAGAAADAPPLT